MNTHTTTSSKNTNKHTGTNESAFGRVARNFLAEVCRALEVVGAAYQKGALPRL